MTWKEIDKNLSSRSGQSLRSCLSKDKNKADIRIIQSPNDDGVIRNGGRRGAAFGARVLTNALLKLAKRDFSKNITITCLGKENRIQKDFDTFQQEQSDLIASLEESSVTIHIGGGHDHAYPLINALLSKHDHITVINLDAHLDTRADELKHSGTPFRQLKQKYANKLDLIQIGIHDFANVEENYANLEMDIVTVNQLKIKTSNFTQNSQYIDEVLKQVKPDSHIILSLDVDAIDGSQMKAVSAVNHDGLPMNFINEFFSKYKELNQKQKVVGLYEYNPLYDDIACGGARLLSATLYNFII